MADHSVRISTLDENVTVYDLEGNVIKQIPEPPETPPKVTYFNIVEYEDKLMGIDPDEKPDFFVDFETDERFIDIEKNPQFNKPIKMMDRISLSLYSCMIIIYGMMFALGYCLTDI